MTATEILKKMEEAQLPAWSLDDAKDIVSSLGGKSEVVDLAERYCLETRGNKRSDCIVLMYCVTLITEKLEQEQQQ